MRSKILLLIFLLITAWSFAKGKNESSAQSSDFIFWDEQISAQGAIGRMEEAMSGPFYTGDGGREMRLAILAPEAQGDVPAYLPLYIQGLLNNNFSKFSAISLIDRQNLDRIIAEQDLAANGRFSDRDFVSIGNLTNAQYLLIGTILRLTGGWYSLQLAITDSSTGVQIANYMMDGTLSQFEGRGMLINQAAADLLNQIGVELTEAGRRTLLTGNTSSVMAEAGLARGITAQAGGEAIEALFNFTQSISFDPSQIEALSRLNILSSSISGGTISQMIVNDIQARDQWIEIFKETTSFFNDHPPFEITFDPNLIQIGDTNYRRRTANLGMRIALDPSEAGFGALNALLEGLEKTGRRGVWGFDGWPLREINPRTQGTVVFGGRNSFSYRVEVALLNEARKTLSRSSITLNTGQIRFSAGDTKVTPPPGVLETIRFSNVNAEDLTSTLTIVIVSVNGIPSPELNATGYMRIETGSLEEQDRAAMAQRTQEEQAAANRQAQAERAAAARQAESARQTAARAASWNRYSARAYLPNTYSAYYQWTDSNLKGLGIDLGFYGSPVPFFAFGIELRFGIDGNWSAWLDAIDQENMGLDVSSSGLIKLHALASPTLGLVIPVNNNKVFGKFLLEAGIFGRSGNGRFFDYLTPAFDIGILLNDSLSIKYRGSWYENHYVNAICIGFGS